MSAPFLRTQPIDRRRLTMEERSSYKPQKRLGAIARAKAFKRQYATEQNRKPFATEQKPGTGGFTQGIARQQDRMRIKGAEERRAKSFRPENAISSDIYDKLAT